MQPTGPLRCSCGAFILVLLLVLKGYTFCINNESSKKRLKRKIFFVFSRPWLGSLNKRYTSTMTGPEHNRAKRRCQASVEVTACGQQVDNSGTTLQKLFQLYRQADLCDVQLQVGVHLFHAHRLILSMSSDVFKTMLTDAKWPDARKARIVLNEEPECVKVCC